MGNVLLCWKLAAYPSSRDRARGRANLKAKVSQLRSPPPVRKWASHWDWMNDKRDIRPSRPGHVPADEWLGRNRQSAWIGHRMLSAIFIRGCIPNQSVATPGPLGVLAVVKDKLSLANAVRSAYGVQRGRASRPRFRMGAS
jgi:hypothetical protein